MKKVIKISGFLALAVMLLNACKPDNDFSIGQPENRLAQLAGSWKIQSVIQTDLNAKNNNYVDFARPEVNVQQQDITAAFPFTDIVLTFAESPVNAPTTFSVNYGSAPRIFKNTSGIWQVDDLNTPGNIKLINGTDTLLVKLAGVNNLGANLMTLQRIKYQGTKAVIQYDYNFKKI